MLPPRLQVLFVVRPYGRSLPALCAARLCSFLAKSCRSFPFLPLEQSTDLLSQSVPSVTDVLGFRAPRGPRDGGRGDRICARIGGPHNTAVGLGLS